MFVSGDALYLRAARNGRSMEAEVRSIIEDAVNRDTRQQLDLATAIRRIVGPIGEFELPEIPRLLLEPPTFQ